MTMAGTGATASQAWAILKRHARDEINPLRLHELCRDNDRVSSLVTVHNPTPNRMLVADLSRQRMTLETLNHLLRLASARGVRKYITQLAWGENDPDNPILPHRLQQKENDRGHKNRRLKGTASLEKEGNVDIPITSFHLSLRVPKGSQMLTASGGDALTAIHQEWDRIKRISESIRGGQLSGVTGSMIRDVVVVGRGVSIMALRFIYLALCKDETATIGRMTGLHDRGIRGIKFLTSVDPVRTAGVVGALDPASTLVINIALRGDEETNIAANTLKTWLVQALGNARNPEVVLGKHMMLVTGNKDMTKRKDIKPESIFVIPEHCKSEPFSTFTAANLLPLSIVFGWPIVQQLLTGAHLMDSHFVETNPRHNLPILLALTDIWNECLLNSKERIISPFSEAFAAYPAFCATLEAQTCGHAFGSTNGSSMVIDGGLHHAYDKALYQADQVIPSELLMTMDSQTSYNAATTDALNGMNDVHAAQDMLICSMFAHADELAFGTDTKNPDIMNYNSRTETAINLVSEEVSDGNRPSTLLMCDKCDAFVCGQLCALAEHRAIVKARLRNIDPFAKEVGSAIRIKRTNALKQSLEQMFAKLSNGEDLEEDDEVTDGQPVNLSTRTILRHYANMMKGQRMYGEG